MALDTVADFINDARVLLQDEVAPYRYSDAQIVTSLNYAFMETRRIRPDVVKSFFNSSLPTYSASSPTTSVALDPQYRLAFLYFICGMVQLRDDEATQDQRASGFMNKFTSSLLAAGG